jgi:hypothetical protein
MSMMTVGLNAKVGSTGLGVSGRSEEEVRRPIGWPRAGALVPTLTRLLTRLLTRGLDTILDTCQVRPPTGKLAEMLILQSQAKHHQDPTASPSRLSKSPSYRLRKAVSSLSRVRSSSRGGRNRSKESGQLSKDGVTYRSNSDIHKGACPAVHDTDSPRLSIAILPCIPRPIRVVRTLISPRQACPSPGDLLRPEPRRAPPLASRAHAQTRLARRGRRHSPRIPKPSAT